MKLEWYEQYLLGRVVWMVVVGRIWNTRAVWVINIWFIQIPHCQSFLDHLLRISISNINISPLKLPFCALNTIAVAIIARKL